MLQKGVFLQNIMKLISAVITAMVLCSPMVVEAAKRCYVKEADVVFILDSSSSIWKPDFIRQLNFVNDVVDEFNIGLGPKESRVGVVTFSDRAHIQFNLNQHGTKAPLKKAVLSSKYLMGGTDTAKAIQMARSVMFSKRYGARADVDHIAVVITDGKSKDSKSTLLQAELARAKGIQIFAIGVGEKVDISELDGIASEPASSFVYRVANYKALSSIISNLATQTCIEIEETTTPEQTTESTTQSTTPTTRRQTTTTERPTTTTERLTTTTTVTTTTAVPTTTPVPTTTTTEITTSTAVPTTTELAQGDGRDPFKLCGGKPADVFFILDSSTSIWNVDFKKQLQFVKDVIDTFDIGSTKTRVGVSTFSDTVHPIIDFNQYNSKKQLKAAVDGVEYQGGLTFTGDAIEDMLTRAFSKRSARRGVAHIGVVITDGESREQEKTAIQSQLAQDAGIYMFAIGVGNAVNQDELRAIASNPDSNFVYTVNSYDALDTLKNILAQKACEVEITPTPIPIIKDEPKCTRSATDLMFTLDSRRASLYGTRNIITLIDNVVRDLEISMLKLRIGLLQDACLANRGDIGLNPYADSFRKQLNNIQYSNMASLINRLRTEMMFMQGQNERVAVLFVDDKLDRPNEAIQEARLAQRQGIEMFVVAVGKTYDNGEVNSLCSAPAANHVIRVPSYSHLLSARQQVGQKICIPSQLQSAMYY